MILIALCTWNTIFLPLRDISVSKEILLLRMSKFYMDLISQNRIYALENKNSSVYNCKLCVVYMLSSVLDNQNKVK